MQYLLVPTNVNKYIYSQFIKLTLLGERDADEEIWDILVS